MLICSMYGEFQSNAVFSFFFFNIDLNLSIVCFILTLFGALLRRCHSSWPTTDTCVLGSLLKELWSFLVVLFFFWETTSGIYKGGRQTLFRKANKVWFIQLQPGTFQEESLFFCLVALHKMTIVLCISHFTLSSDVMWTCAWASLRQMQYWEWECSYYPKGFLEATVLKLEC